MSDVVPANNVLMSFIERAAKDETFNVEKFEVLLRLQMEVGEKQSRREFNAAMAEAQSEMLPVLRSAQNKHLGNRYAKLEDIDRDLRPIITRHGFSVRFGSAPAPREGDMRITCTVAHQGGYFEESHLDAPVSMTGSQGGRMAITPVQAVGSVVTYLRRYLLSLAFNVVLADDDDDGEGTRRAAAAPMPRAARIAEKVPAYDTAWLAPLDEPNPAAWIVNLELVLGNCTSQDEVTEAGGHVSVRNAVAKAPPDIRRRVSELLAAHFARLAPEDDADPDTGEIRIKGEEKAEA